MSPSTLPAVSAHHLAAAPNIPAFGGETRLFDFTLHGGKAPAALSPESFIGQEALSQLFTFDLMLCSPDPGIDLHALLGRQAGLQVRLADGRMHARTGYITEAEYRDHDGGLARYRVRLAPWLWQATQRSTCRVFEEASVRDIVDAVLAAYAPRAHWQWADDTERFLADLPPRSFCAQYRETDYAFVSRLLAEEGLGFCFVEREPASDAPDLAPAHSLLIFSDPALLPEDSCSASAAGGRGIRFHRAGAQEAQDAVTAFAVQRQLGCSASSLASWDYKPARLRTGTLASAPGWQGEHTPPLESFELPGAHALASDAALQRSLRVLREAHECRQISGFGTASVRSFRPGHCFLLTQGPFAPGDAWELPHGLDHDARNRFVLLAVRHAGVNNLPGAGGQAAALAAMRDWLAEAAADPACDLQAVLPPEPLDALLGEAASRGYSNAFTAQPAALPWRPALYDDTGLRLNPRPTASGVQTATVVGAEGAGATEGDIHTDALHRIRVRFAWQQSGGAHEALRSAWLRVASRAAGPGLGTQFIPRVGQEVLVGFLEGDIDRPVVLGALYTGRGEGGLPPTPGGRERGTAQDADVFGQAADHRPAAQGNLAGGNSPAWHGEAAAQAAQRNRAALNGVKSAAWNTAGAAPLGYTQLVFDDSDGQLRVQLATTQAASQLNLGHLVHQADNYRGSHRGDGFELRSDAYGALRAARGLLLSTWPLEAGADTARAEPAGEACAPVALLKQASALARAMSDIAATHLAVPLAAHLGSRGAQASLLDTQMAPLAAQARAQNGVLGPDWNRALADARARNTQPGRTGAGERLPLATDPLVTLAGRGGLVGVAGGAQHWAVADTLSWSAGAEAELGCGGALRLHAGQAIGLLAGTAGNPPAPALAAHAARGPVRVEAQHGTLEVAARAKARLASASGPLSAAAAKKIHLATAGGAAITLEGGNLTVQCPGTLTIHAAKKSFAGGGRVPADLARFAEVGAHDRYFIIEDQASGDPLPGVRYRITTESGQRLEGKTDAMGRTQNVVAKYVAEHYSIEVLETPEHG